MPFRKRTRLTLENCGPDELYYYIDYALHDAIPANMGRFHAQWRRENPTTGIAADAMPALVAGTKQLFRESTTMFSQAPTS